VGSFQEGRAELARLLRDSLGRGWYVPEKPELPDVVAKPTILIERTRVERMPAAPKGHTIDTFSLYMIAARQQDENNLDELLEEVLDTLDALKVGWQTATRGDWKNQNPAYVINIPIAASRKD